MITIYEYYLEEDFKSHMKKHWKKYAGGAAALGGLAAGRSFLKQKPGSVKRKKVNVSQNRKEDLYKDVDPSLRDWVKSRQR